MKLCKSCRALAGTFGALLALASCAPHSTTMPPRSADLVIARQLRALARERPLVVAHRGDSKRFPENTLPAFAAAITSKSNLVELDFHQTLDGELVVLHDETLDRTTDSARVLGQVKARVAERALADLQRLDAGGWKHKSFRGTPVPTLAEALEAIHSPRPGTPPAITMVEHKAGDPAKLLAILRQLDLVEAVLVQSFDWQWLERVHALEPRLSLAALSGQPITAEVLADLDRTGACMAHWEAKTLRLEDVAELHRRGYLVGIYTVDDELGWLGAMTARVDAITTNQPGALQAFVERQQRSDR